MDIQPRPSWRTIDVAGLIQETQSHKGEGDLVAQSVVDAGERRRSDEGFEGVRQMVWNDVSPSGARGRTENCRRPIRARRDVACDLVEHYGYARPRGYFETPIGQRANGSDPDHPEAKTGHESW